MLNGSWGIAASSGDIEDSPAPITLTDLSPGAGDIITRSEVLVTGSVSHKDGLEIGVMVNGEVALVYDGRFAANHVRLPKKGETEEGKAMFVGAFDTNGKRVTQTISADVQPSIRRVELKTDFWSSLAPMENTLEFSKNFIESSRPIITSSGPADPVIEAGKEPDTWNISMTEPGIYIFSVDVRDETGEHYTDQVAVLAYGRDTLDALLQGKWDGMKQALIAGDAEKALGYFTYGQRRVFQEIFSSAGKEGLAHMARDMQDIELISQKNDTAKYRIRKEMNFKGKTETITSHIYFQKERDGIWRIRDF
ncbi:hypothetical protein VU12_13155 [Desulfobulbus sp. US4]|nr:hypothetical protein [Desulfobulbus sp. US4]